jgi:hypothetical protein
MDRIEELRRLEGNATPGPWMVADDRVHEHGAEVAIIDAGLSVVRTLDDSLIEPADPEADAHFIAAARNAMPLLLDVVEAARQTGWNERDGRCWCPESRETTGKPEHEPRCARLRAALAALDSQP